MPDTDVSDFNKLKKVLLTMCNLTEDGYRKRFREVKPETEEMPATWPSGYNLEAVLETSTP